MKTGVYTSLRHLFAFSKVNELVMAIYRQPPHQPDSLLVSRPFHFGNRIDLHPHFLATTSASGEKI
jgi:hypothetical protein